MKKGHSESWLGKRQRGRELELQARGWLSRAWGTSPWLALAFSLRDSLELS